MIGFLEKFIFLQKTRGSEMQRLLIAVAIQEELKIVKKCLDQKKVVSQSPSVTEGVVGNVPVDVVLTSMGMEAAKSTLMKILDPNRHAGVLILGYCGGLSLTLKVGDIVIARSVFSQAQKTPISVDPRLAEELGKSIVSQGFKYRCVPLITEPLVIETPDAKQKLFQETNAEAVDMESSEILSVAEQKGLKGITVKIVIDDAETELPKFNDYFKKTGKMDHLSVTQLLMSQPSLSLQLSQNMKKGRQVLTEIIPSMIEVVSKHFKIIPFKAAQ